MLETSTEINAIATALAQAQSEFSSAVKSRINPYYKSKYADLEAITEVYRLPLAKNKIAIIQPISIDAESITVITMLIHESGQFFKSSLTYKLAKTDIQFIGSIASYLRRYALQSFLSIPTGDEDDDGEAAMVIENRAKSLSEYAKEISLLNTKEQFSKYSAGLTEEQKEKLKIILTQKINTLKV